jgi:hypothetical protein
LGSAVDTDTKKAQNDKTPHFCGVVPERKFHMMGRDGVQHNKLIATLPRHHAGATALL